jgi:hypothetical protein
MAAAWRTGIRWRGAVALTGDISRWFASLTRMKRAGRGATETRMHCSHRRGQRDSRGRPGSRTGKCPGAGTGRTWRTMPDRLTTNGRAPMAPCREAGAISPG